MANEVFVAMHGGTVGYFGTWEEIPEDWVPAGTRDIADIMTSLNCSKEHALEVMNSHWKPAQGVATHGA